MHLARVVGEGLWSIDALLRTLGSISLISKLGASWGSQGLWMGAAALANHPGALQHGVHCLSGVGAHSLDDLLLAVLLWVVLKVGLRVGRHQWGSGC